MGEENPHARRWKITRAICPYMMDQALTKHAAATMARPIEHRHKDQKS